MYIWPKYGNPDFNRCWLIKRTNSHAQNWVNLEFKVQFDLKDQSQSPHKTIGISTFTLLVVVYITAPNLVILAERVAELSRGQARDWRTHERTHRQTDRQTNGHTHTQATTIPEGQHWPRVKTKWYGYADHVGYDIRVSFAQCTG